MSLRSGTVVGALPPFPYSPSSDWLPPQPRSFQPTRILFLNTIITELNDETKALHTLAETWVKESDLKLEVKKANFCIIRDATYDFTLATQQDELEDLIIEFFPSMQSFKQKSPNARKPSKRSCTISGHVMHRA